MPQATNSTSKKSYRKQILGGILLVIVSVCITLLSLEIIVRLLATPYPPDIGHIFACHNSLGWIGAPNFAGMFEDGNFRQELNFNSLGMHDTEHSRNRTSDTFRILLLGDSFVHAIQVGEAATAHQILENRLNEADRPGEEKSFEVISSGVVNWGTNQELIYYREQGRQFQPNLVVLMFYIGNDFQDNLPGNVMTVNGFNCYAPYFALCDGNLNPTPLTYAPGISRLENNCAPIRRSLINGMGKLYQHSRLYRQIEPLIVANRPRQQFGQDYPLAFTALYLPNEEAELAQAHQLTQATIAQLQQEVEADGAQFVAVLISPWPIIQLGLLSPAEQEIFLTDNPLFAQAQANRPNQRMTQFLKSHNIPFIDLTNPMIEYAATHDRIPLYIIGEGHWTAEGNQVVADILAEWLTTTLQWAE
jgi:lysophospholipase L1-like esterase